MAESVVLFIICFGENQPFVRSPPRSGEEKSMRTCLKGGAAQPKL